jgi:hypothetical protein
MNLAQKSFKDNKTGEVVRVIDSFDNIAILESKEKVAVNRLLDPTFYTEQIDPANFFNNQGAYNSLAEKIKNIPTENLRDDVSGAASVVMVDGVGVQLPSANESAVIMSDPEDEKAELARKYGVNIDNKSSVQNQNAAFARILGEGSEDELPKVTSIEVNKVAQIEVNREYTQPTQVIEVNDPIINMFKGVKRNINFKMNIEISNKIPRLDFIEMMEDSYEVSIIDYLAEEFTQNLLRNPSQIKETIKDKIMKVVYGTNTVTETKPEVETKVVKAEVKAPVKKAAKKATKKEESK